MLYTVFNTVYKVVMLNRANRKKIADRLEAYRLDRKWTLEQLASVTNMSVGGLHKIINGKCTPTALTVRKLSDALPGFLEVA